MLGASGTLISDLHVKKSGADCAHAIVMATLLAALEHES